MHLDCARPAPDQRRLSLDDVIAALLEALDRPLAERVAWVDRFRRQGEPRDALARAELALLDAMVAAGEDALDGLLDRLEHAVHVFEANERPDRAALAWLYLSKWYVVCGDTAEGIACGRRALAIPEIDLQTRLALTHPMLPGLAELLCFDEAMQCLQREFLPAMTTARPSPRLALAWTDAAFLHVVDALRVGRLDSIFTMDLDDTAVAADPAARERMRPALDASKRCLQQAVETGSRSASYVIAHTRGMVQALEGDGDSAFHSFGREPRDGLTEVTRLHNCAWALRINALPAEAVPYLRTALAAAVRLRATEYERASQHELSLCLSALGETDAAYAALSRFTVLHARAAARSNRLSSRFEREPSAASQAAPARRTVPPYVARARRLIRDTVADRLSLGEMAARVGTGPRSLQAGLKDYLGTSFVAAYRSAAMDEARRLLQLTALPVAEIARRVGYGSATAFSRDYRAATGRSPMAFRNAAEADDV